MRMKNLAFATIKELRELILKKEVSADELIDLSIERIKKYDDKIGAVLQTFARDTVRSQDGSNGALAGIPGLVKDVICQRGRVTSCSSKILEHFVSPIDATAVERLHEAGAISIGRTNCDEFAMGTSNETSAYKKCFNPWDLTRSPGGSGGGSAAAVAAGMVPWALGTETGGSVRLPAAFCGIVGSKPTYGLVSRWGLIAYGSSLDAIGVNTRTVYDNALVLGQMAGADGRDGSMSQQKGPFDYVSQLTGKIRPGLKIGIVKNAVYAKGIDPEVSALLAQAMRELEKLGAELVEVSLPTMDHGAAVYFMISRAEAASNLARFDGVRYGHRSKNAEDLREMYEMSRAEGFGREVKRRILLGNFVLSAGHADQYYVSACKVRNMMRSEFLETLSRVDLLFAPVSPTVPFKVGAFAGNPLAMDLLDYFTCPINLAKIPAVSVPCGFVNNLPISFQLIGRDFSEALIYQTAYAYEQQTPWHTMHPDWLKD